MNKKKRRKKNTSCRKIKIDSFKSIYREKKERNRISFKHFPKKIKIKKKWFSFPTVTIKFRIELLLNKVNKVITSKI